MPTVRAYRLPRTDTVLLGLNRDVMLLRFARSAKLMRLATTLVYARLQGRINP